MDRNQVIGFGLLALLLIGYISYNQYNEKQYYAQRHADSVAYAKAHPAPVIDTIKAAANAPVAVDDSATIALRKLQPASYYGQEQMVTLQNSKLAIQFSTKGAYPVSAQLTEYKTYHKEPFFLFKGTGNSMSTLLPIDNNKSTGSLYFTPVLKTEPNGDKTIDFTADLGQGKKAEITYTLPANDYMMRCNIILTGITESALPLNWQMQTLHTEKDISTERMSTQVYYRFMDKDNDYFTVRSDEKGISKTEPMSWLGFRKQYFSTVMISDEGFLKTEDKAYAATTDTMVEAHNTADLQLPLKTVGASQIASFRWYIGPNDYKTLRAYNLDLDNMVPLGNGLFSFVKYISKFALIPFFYMLSGFITSYPLIIILMTILIRFVLSFFTYKSYLSAAKMRVLKPELDELRKRTGGDQQKMSMEQMKLYKSAGVNPLGGCLPMLVQLPILLSLYYMIPSFIEFRQKSFLWADDLSAYDSIYNFGFSIPLYGDHISLFTLLMTASSLFIALFNRNNTPQDPNNPALKYMPYFMPIIFLGMFNKMAAALTFYYTVSNILSIVQQVVIQKFFINEKAIHAKLQENRAKPVSVSKWQQKLEEVQKMQAARTKGTPRINKK